MYIKDSVYGLCNEINTMQDVRRSLVASYSILYANHQAAETPRGEVGRKVVREKQVLDWDGNHHETWPAVWCTSFDYIPLGFAGTYPCGLRPCYVLASRIFQLFFFVVPLARVGYACPCLFRVVFFFILSLFFSLLFFQAPVIPRLLYNYLALYLPLYFSTW